MNIGEKIKENRLKKEWTQGYLAELLNVSRSAVSSWEVGRNYPDLDTVIAISDLFDISLDQLLREDREMTKMVTKKVKMNRVYRLLLLLIAALLIGYIGFNLKLRMAETRYRNNLTQAGWTQNFSKESFSDKNAYTLQEDDVTYWTYVLPAGYIGFPLSEQTINVVADKNGVVVNTAGKAEIELIVQEGSNTELPFTVSMQVDSAGNLVEKKESWSQSKVQQIETYLKNHQVQNQKLIQLALKKRSTIIAE